MSGRLSLPEIPDLERCLEDLLRQVPRGAVTTFGDLAEALGDIVAARWVAEVLAESPAEFPWHRVLLRTGGWPGEDRERHQRQRDLLAAEGVAGDESGVARAVPRFTQFASSHPLARLSEWQRELSQAVDLSPLTRAPKMLAGLDLSYAPPERAVAAWIGAKRGNCDPNAEETRTHEAVVTFPYITGYLTFRELPVLLELLSSVKQEGLAADVLLVDGSGVLHPRRAGIATTLGLVAGRPTIGVTKRHLCGKDAGQRDECLTWLELDDQRLGARLQRRGSKTPLYVSPGHGLSLEQAVELVEEMLDERGRPGLIWQADQISRAAARRLSRSFNP